MPCFQGNATMTHTDLFPHPCLLSLSLSLSLSRARSLSQLLYYICFNLHTDVRHSDGVDVLHVHTRKDLQSQLNCFESSRTRRTIQSGATILLPLVRTCQVRRGLTLGVL